VNDEPAPAARRRELDNEPALAALRRQPEQAPLVPKREYLAVEKWREYRRVVGSIIADLGLWAIILGVLTVYHYFIENINYPQEWKEMLETLHFRMSYAFLLVSSLGLILRVVIHEVKSLKSAE
jgi:hypothetical protein